MWAATSLVVAMVLGAGVLMIASGPASLPSRREIDEAQPSTASALPTLAARATDSGSILSALTDLQRMSCIAHTYPVFDNSAKACDQWTCSPYDPRSQTATSSSACCVSRSSRSSALRLLNGTNIVFLGDSTARRAACHLTAYLQVGIRARRTSIKTHSYHELGVVGE